MQTPQIVLVVTSSILGAAFWIWFGSLAGTINFYLRHDRGVDGAVMSFFMGVLGPIGLLFVATSLIDDTFRWHLEQKQKLKIQLLMTKRSANEQVSDAKIDRRNAWSEESKRAAKLLPQDGLQLAQTAERKIPSTTDS
jgi:uncharacterized membrane protein YeaQ/YmgE (transglycosylase-associated protein family)